MSEHERIIRCTIKSSVSERVLSIVCGFIWDSTDGSVRGAICNFIVDPIGRDSAGYTARDFVRHSVKNFSDHHFERVYE